MGARKQCNSTSFRSVILSAYRGLCEPYTAGVDIGTNPGNSSKEPSQPYADRGISCPRIQWKTKDIANPPLVLCVVMPVYRIQEKDCHVLPAADFA